MTMPPAAAHADRIAAWLPAARWFAGKGRRLAAATVADEAAIDGGRLLLTLLDVQSDGEAGRYCVPVAADAATDAATSPEFARWLVETSLTGGTCPGRRGRFVGRPVPAREPAGDWPGGVPAVAPLGGDASNTSLVVRAGGRGVAVKLIRRCQAGPQPEVEVGTFLATAVGWPGTPPLLGSLAYEPADGSAATVLATVHAYLPGCRTAWETLGEQLAAGGLAGPRREDLLGLAAAIGRLTGEMHTALASRPDLPAFAAAPPGPGACRAEAAGMAAHARSVLRRAAARATTLPEPLGRRVAAVAAAAEVVAAGFAAVADPATTPAVIRVHGDYHLGQVLVREADGLVFPIDFEGEPSRPLAERRAKTSPAKDVAGMCRSFDYALRQAAKAGGPAASPADLAVIEGRFLAAYESVAQGKPWWPADPAAAERLLAAWKLDKAVYELGYELDNRPDWADVPLAALEAHRAAASSGDAASEAAPGH